MSAPKRPRKRLARNPNKARHGDSNYFAKLAQTEEGRAQIREWRKLGASRAGRRQHNADGYSAKATEALRATAERDADRIIEIMDEEKLIEEPTDELLGNDKDMAKEALKATIVVLRLPGDVRNKLAAARTILEYTRSKPASTANIAVSTAEEFLGALLAKDKAQST